MKITDVRPWLVTGPPTDAASGPAAHLQQYLFVQVDTDEGLTGWGEVTSYPGVGGIIMIVAGVLGPVVFVYELWRRRREIRAA